MTGRRVRIAALVTWTATVAFAWFDWTNAAVHVPLDAKPLTEPERGVVILVTSGCCGTTWVSGLAALALVTYLVRR